MPSVLIVDDEPNIVSSLTGALGREDYQVEGAGSLAEARRALREAFDFVLLDVRLPDGDGLELLAELRSQAPESIVIMMSGHATIETAVKATKLGAHDFLEKPLSLERLLVMLRNAAATRALQSENRRNRAGGPHPIVGRSPAVQRVIALIERAGPSHASMLISGESGCGKELVARSLHAASPRADLPFIAVNCAAIPEELIESELFGHERGAFTGATQARRGRFEEAHGGTLFLDEVSELSPRAQTKLLRVLQEHELSRVGGNRAIKVDVRVIAATNRDLKQRVGSGQFREDLYYRLNVIPLEVPPLREREGDIALLVDQFAREFAREAGRAPLQFTAEALERLARHSFPGNVRELRNLIERLTIMTSSPVVGLEQVRDVLPSERDEPEPPSRLGEAVDAFERAQITETLRKTDGNMAKAAKLLGLERSHLYKKMKKLGLSPEPGDQS